VTARNIREGAFVLGAAYRYFPKGTIHVAVIDPGVGSGRRALLVEGSGYYFIAPDNGVLSHVLADALQKASPAEARGSSECIPRDLPPGFRAVALTRNRYWRPAVSDTFHGRDIFAPVAAHLSLGVPMEEFGDPVSSIQSFPRSSPLSTSGGTVQGQVIHIDGFGNLITNVRAGDLPEGDVEIELAGHRLMGVSRSYEEGDGLLAIIGSSGCLEISEKNGSAAEKTGAEMGTTVVIRPLA
jgi:hypothetical protein